MPDGLRPRYLTVHLHNMLCGYLCEAGRTTRFVPGERHVDGVDRRVRRAERGGDCPILVRSERRRAADLAHGPPARLTVLQEFGRLIGIVVDRHAGRFHQDFDHARRRFGLVPFRLGHGKRIDDKDHDVAHLIERRLEADQMQRFHQFQGIQHAAHAEVIGHAAIHDMEVGSVDAVAKLRLFLDMAGRARGGPGRLAVLDKRLDPVRRLVVAATAVVVQRDWREHHWHGGRGRRRP